MKHLLLIASLALAGTAYASTDARDNTSQLPSQGSQIGGRASSTFKVYRISDVTKDVNGTTITTIATVWTPSSGKKFRLMGGSISVSAAMNVLFEDNAAGAGNFIFRTPKLSADTPYNFVVSGGQGKLSAAANNVLKATGSAAGTITGTLWGVEE